MAVKRQRLLSSVYIEQFKVIHLSEEQQLIKDTARGFARDVLRPQAAANDEAARFPVDAINQMGELGFSGHAGS